MTDLNDVVLTAEGKQKLEEELVHLKTTRRIEVADRIEAAKEMGDISENAEYATAKDDQAFLEARINELEKILAFAKIIEAPEAGEVVGIGATVVLEQEAGAVRTYTIVGYNEANPSEGKISNESPLGQALVGKRVGEKVSVATPSGEKKYLIKKVQ